MSPTPPSRRRPARTAAAAARTASLTIDRLEPRRLFCSLGHDAAAAHVQEAFFDGAVAQSAVGPADIVWTNRGTSANDSDRFNSVFGAAAEQARGVIDTLITHFERMIGSFNYADGSSNFNLSLSMSSSGSSLGASASLTGTLNGKPKSGSVSMGRGSNGLGGGWFVDPTPNDHSEFLGTIVNAFSGNATVGGPAVGLSDFYTVAAAELTHALGLFGGSGSVPGWNSLATNTGATDTAEGGGVGTFYVFRGPSIKHLMTSNNGGSGGSSFGGAIHSAGPNGSGLSFDGDVYVGGQDIGNAIYEQSRRYIPNLAFALMFRDAYGYSTVDPAQFGTFYADLNRANGTLTVRGGQGTVNDIINVRHDPQAGTITVSVDPFTDVAGSGALPGPGNLPAWTSTFAVADVSSIVVDAAGGNDTLTIESLDADTTISIQMGSSNDVVNIGAPGGGGGSVAGILQRLTINDSLGTDTINVNDRAAADNADWAMAGDVIRRDGVDLAQVSGFEWVNFNLGGGNDTFTFAAAAALPRPFVDGGGGHDTINVNETAPTTELVVLPSDGNDDVNVNPDGGATARALFTTTGRFGALHVSPGGTATVSEGGTRTVTFAGVEIDGDGALNLNDNALVIDYTGAGNSPLAAVRSLLSAGYAGSAWNGAGGIRSGTAAATTGRGLGYAEASALFAAFPTNFAGETVDDTSVLVRYTLAGDANLDRAVGIADFSLLAAGFNAPGGWSAGNFNYDADVNLADFSLLAAAFNTALPAADGGGDAAVAGGPTIPAARAAAPFATRPIDDADGGLAADVLV